MSRWPENAKLKILTVAGREVAISNPDKLLFPKPKHTKLDLARYYVAVAEGALRGAGGRPNMLVRYPDGIEGEHFYQKRAPKSRPPWIEVVELRFPSGRVAEEVVPRDAAALAWLANLACLELHPHPVRAEDLDHPDELRVDLDPVPGITWKQIQEVAAVSRAVLNDFNLVGWPKTSGSRGMHICRAYRTALGLRRSASRRARARARSREARADSSPPASGGRRSATACSSTTTRTRRTAPSPPRTRCGRRPTRASPRRLPGTRSTTATRLISRWPPCPRASRSSAICTRGSTSTRARSKACSSSSSARAWAMRRGRRITGDRRRSLRASNPPSASTIQAQIGATAADRDRTRAPQGGCAWRVWNAGKRDIRKLLRICEPADVLVDAMRGRYSTWTRIRVNLQHVPEELRPAQEPLDPDEKIRSSS